jgi:hypothetical protein
MSINKMHQEKSNEKKCREFSYHKCRSKKKRYLFNNRSCIANFKLNQEKKEVR